jgi:hypothetical protein
MKYTLVKSPEIPKAPAVSLDSFAETHALEMVVFERPAGYSPNARYYARFKDVDIKRGCMIGGGGGNGDTPEDAIHDYACMIRGKLLVKNGMSESRVEFMAPNEWSAS